MKKNVVLIRTPAVLPKTSITAQQGVPSLALAYLGASLKKENYSVSYIDSVGEKLEYFYDFGTDGLLAAGLNFKEIIDRIPSDIDYIGVSCQFSNDWILAKKLLITLNQNFKNVPIFIGGEHVSAEYELILKTCPFLTACVLGEAEETIVHLLNELSELRDLHKVDGIAYLKNASIIKNKSRQRLKKIDEIAWPDWKSLPLEKYLDAGLGMAAQGIRSMPILASRGCPYRCTFCSAPQMWDAKWYGRNISDVINEIKFYQNEYKIDHLEFYDMSPSINKKWLEALVDELQSLSISWNFPSGIRSENLSPELILKMKLAGCYKLTFAIETSAPWLIKQIKKKIDPNRALSLIEYSSSIGLITKVNFIWGLENQKARDILYDYYFIFRLALAGLHDASCFAFVPYPGSEDFNRLKMNNKIPQDESYDQFLAFNVYNNPFKMKSWSVYIKNWQMTYWTLGGMSLFYILQFSMRPFRIIKFISRLYQKKPATMLELAFYGLYINFFKGKKRISKKIYYRNNIEAI